MNSRNKSLVGRVLDPDSMNPDPDILLDPDPGCYSIRIQAVDKSGSRLLLSQDSGCF
jgi:hypothetical protein